MLAVVAGSVVAVRCWPSMPAWMRVGAVIAGVAILAWGIARSGSQWPPLDGPGE